MIAIFCASKARKPFSQQTLKELHDSCSRRNRELGLTGFLSGRNGHIIQYLEGPEDAVNAALTHIENDQTQGSLRSLGLGPIQQRRFLRWDMHTGTDGNKPDILIHELIENLMNSSDSSVEAESPSGQRVLEMLEQMSRSQKAGEPEPQHLVHTSTDSDLKPPYVVVLGASAGGVNALQSIIRTLKPELDAAVIVIQHFSPEKESMMARILQRLTPMPVRTAVEGMPVESGRVYITPPGEVFQIRHGCFALRRQHRSSRHPHYPIDICFRATALEYGEKAIAVVLSGTGSDGSRGARIVNEAGGVVLAQSPETAEFSGMPESTINTGMAHEIISPTDIADFVNHLNDEPDDVLRDDILIAETRFFRDPDAWELLKEPLMSLIDTQISAGETLRIWVTACSTGEEAYTIGIVLSELLENLDEQINFKIYATDIERKALEHASIGMYSERSLEYVNENRRKRFFSHKAGGYIISRKIRENVIFAPHDFVRNAPFTRMHLVTCRNALHSMSPESQQIAIQMLHGALNVQGILFLGPSETLGNLQNEFHTVQREWHQYRKLRELPQPLHPSEKRLRNAPLATAATLQPWQDNGIATRTNNLLEVSLDVLVQYTGTTSLLVDYNGTVMMLIADPTGILLHHGQPTRDLIRMLPEGLRSAMNFAVSTAFKEGKAVEQRQLRCKAEDLDEHLVDIEVIPHLPSGVSNARYALVLMNESADIPTEPVGLDADGSASEETEQLRLELEKTRKALQTAINDLESSNNEQRLANEQLSVTNEELQSTNEELYTVNYEYQTKIQELSGLNQDLDNLLESTNLGVIFLDSDLHIRRFTKVATQTVNLLPSDIGRPFADLTHNLQYKNLMSDMRRVLSIGKSINREISRNSVDQLQVDIHPYRAVRGIAQGVLIMFRDIKTRSESGQASEDLDKVH